VEQVYKDHNKVIQFVKDYLSSVDVEDMDISNKRKTLKARVKHLAAEYKFPKDFANYISLFLLVTKFLYVDEQKWKVDQNLAKKIDKEDFLLTNLFKFLFFTRDYNEYYKSPLVFNTPFSNNDFEVVNKRKSVITTLQMYMNNDEVVSFDALYKTLTKRYAFFRDYNDPGKFYYSKGDVFNNKQFAFLFIFKTLNYLGIVDVISKGSSLQDCKFKVSAYGKHVFKSLYSKHEPKRVIKPYKYTSNSQKDNVYKYVFSSTEQTTSGVVQMEAKLETLNKAHPQRDFLRNIKKGIARKAQEENVPNLLS